MKKSDINQMKLTRAKYSLQSLQVHSLDFHGLTLFLNLLYELKFFILLGIISQIFDPKYLTD